METTLLENITTAAAAAGDKAAANPLDGLWSILMLVGMGAVFYFLMIRPQNKRNKAERLMRTNLQIGDQIVTSGGISGKVVQLGEDEITIETGADRTKIKVKRWAVALNESAQETK